SAQDAGDSRTCPITVGRSRARIAALRRGWVLGRKEAGRPRPERRSAPGWAAPVRQAKAGRERSYIGLGFAGKPRGAGGRSRIPRRSGVVGGQEPWRAET